MSAMEQVLSNISLFSNILSFIDDPFDLDAVSRTVSLWRDAVNSYVTKISCRRSGKLNQLLQRFPRITSLSLGLTILPVDDKDLQLVSELVPFLLNLRIELPSEGLQKVTNTGIEALGRLKKLERLHLRGFKQIGDPGLTALGKGCSCLREFSLSGISNIYVGFDAGDEDARIGQQCISHKGLNAVISGSIPGLEILSLEDCPTLDNYCLEIILGCQSLTSLTLLGKLKFSLTELDQAKPKCGRLQRLTVGVKWRSEWTNIDILLETVARSSTVLEDVTLKGQGFSRRGLYSLCVCSSLKSLTLQNETRSIEADILEIVSANQELTCLDLTSWPQIFSSVGDAAIMALASKAPNLKSLSLRSDRITDFALESLAYCSKMTALQLSSSSITNKGLRALAGRCRDLEKVSLAWSRAVGDAGLQMLTASCMHLRSLNVSYCSGLTSSGLSAIAACGSLEVLDVSYTNIDDSSLVGIVRGAPRLRQLSLVKCVLLTGMWAPAMLASLENLNLEGCSAVSDEGVAAISRGCKFLRHLGLQGTRVSDKGIEVLSHCSRLQSLNIACCTEVKGLSLLLVAEACGWLQEIRVSLGYLDESMLSSISSMLDGRACRVSILPRVREYEMSVFL